MARRLLERRSGWYCPPKGEIASDARGVRWGHDYDKYQRMVGGTVQL